MNFNKHYDLSGQHAFLGASKYSWVNYSDEKISDAYARHLATQKGTRLHELARQLIDLGVRLPKSTKALNNYVNDAIGFRMTPELPLYYSENAFGTADSICFRDRLLRIHDLKTGVSPVSLVQLEIYSAFFCLEYDESPKKIEIELRIYQEGQEIVIHRPEPKDILEIMEKIVRFDKTIKKIKTETEG